MVAWVPARIGFRGTGREEASIARGPNRVERGARDAADVRTARPGQPFPERAGRSRFPPPAALARTQNGGSEGLRTEREGPLNVPAQKRAARPAPRTLRP
jgi:hypothetical protein